MQKFILVFTVVAACSDTIVVVEEGDPDGSALGADGGSAEYDSSVHVPLLGHKPVQVQDAGQGDGEVLDASEGLDGAIGAIGSDGEVQVVDGGTDAETDAGGMCDPTACTAEAEKILSGNQDGCCFGAQCGSTLYGFGVPKCITFACNLRGYADPDCMSMDL